MSSDVHLQMIQAVITRLAAQSSTVKGWCVTVTAALLGYAAATKAATALAAIAFYVIAAFAVLDAYYLTLERGYRGLYREAVESSASSFRLDVPPPSAGAVVRALGSPAIAILYGASLVATAAVAVYLYLQ